jgi:hypothetical protein
MKRMQVIVAPRHGAREKDRALPRRLLRRLETIAAPRRIEDTNVESIGDRVIAVGIALSVVGVLALTALHLIDIVFLDRGVDAFDADEDFSASSWATIAATFAAGTGALLAGLVLGRRFFFGLAALFAFLSFDDFMRVHERVGELGTVVGIEKEVELGRVIWPLLFLPLLILGAALLWLAAKQFSGRAAWLLRAGLVLLGSAIPLEAASSGLIHLGYDHRTWPYETEVILEESAELVGWAWIATALTAAVCSTLVRSGRRP